MTNLVEVDNWDAGIYQLETTDPVIGGPDGVDNAPHIALANRTLYLKNLLTALTATVATKAPLANPALTGTPTAPTGAPGLNTTQIATTAFVQAAIAAILDSSPAALDTLNELAAALGDDANFATTMTNALAAKQPLDTDLSAIAALASAADKMPYATGAGTWSLSDLTAFGRSLNAAADAAAAQIVMGIRRRLTAPLTLYVATTGSDANNGLTVGSPFLTMNKAWSVLREGYDLNGQAVTIQLADGTYTSGMSVAGWLVGQTSQGSVVLSGNVGTPANVVIDAVGTTCVAGSNFATFTTQYMELRGGSGVVAQSGGKVTLGAGIRFGAASIQHMGASTGGTVVLSANYSIVGSAPVHWTASNFGLIQSSAITVTLTGTPAFSTAFAIGSAVSEVICAGMTFSGAATGSRYSVSSNGVINTNGGGATYLPGNAVGSTTTGGQYV